MPRAASPQACNTCLLAQPRPPACPPTQPPLPSTYTRTRAQLTAIKGRRDAVAGELDALRARESEGRSDIPGLIAERKEASEVIGALRKKQADVRDAFNAKWQARGLALRGLRLRRGGRGPVRVCRAVAAGLRCAAPLPPPRTRRELAGGGGMQPQPARLWMLHMGEARRRQLHAAAALDLLRAPFATLGETHLAPLPATTLPL